MVEYFCLGVLAYRLRFQVPYTLTYWNRYSADPLKDGVQKLITDFEAKYPWIKIEENSTSDADYKTALPVVLAREDPPDFFY